MSIFKIIDYIGYILTLNTITTYWVLGYDNFAQQITHSKHTADFTLRQHKSWKDVDIIKVLRWEEGASAPYIFRIDKFKDKL